MRCFEEATEQYVWVDINTGLHRISQPLCEDCSHDAQPAESVAVFSVEGEGLPCNGGTRHRSRTVSDPRGRGPELGPDRAPAPPLLGHTIVDLYPVPSGWRLLCECGEKFRAVWQDAVKDRWEAHRREEAENKNEGEEAR